MAKFIEFTPLEQAEFEKWVSERPPDVKAMIGRCPPDRLYRLNNQRVTILSYCEDGTVTVVVSAKFNRVIFERNVFGVFLDDLTECDLPDANEQLGAVLTDEKDVNAFIELSRPFVLKGRHHEP